MDEPTAVSQRTGAEYRLYNPITRREGGKTYHEFRQPKGRSASIVERYEEPSETEPDVVYIVTVRVTGGGEVEEEAYDCGCKNYWMQFESVGPKYICKHIVKRRLTNEEERNAARRQRRSKELGEAYARDYDDLYGL